MKVETKLTKMSGEKSSSLVAAVPPSVVISAAIVASAPRAASTTPLIGRMPREFESRPRSPITPTANSNGATSNRTGGCPSSGPEGNVPGYSRVHGL